MATTPNDHAERVDLFGAPVAPTVEQGTLFAPHVGAAVPTPRGAITAAEMTARRDALGAPAAPIAGETPDELFGEISR